MPGKGPAIDLAPISVPPLIKVAELVSPANGITNGSVHDFKGASSSRLGLSPHLLPNPSPIRAGFRPLSPDLLDSFAPTPGSLSSIIDDPLVPNEAKRQRLTAALVRAASAGDADLLEWLLDKSARARPHVDVNARDGDGVPAIVLATCLRHGECVRILVEAGADVDAVDPAGWSSLHWATSGSDFPLASYLLNHRATMGLRSHKGLAPADLVRRGGEGDALREILSFAEERVQTPPPTSRSDRPSTPSSLAAARTARVQRDAAEKERRRRLDAAMETAKHLEIDISLLGIDPDSLVTMLSPVIDGVEPENPMTNEFVWDRCLPDQMMVRSWWGEIGSAH